MIDFLYKALKPYYKGLFDSSHTTGGEVCVVCERPITETAEPEQCILTKDSYGTACCRCLPCQSLFEGNKNLLGSIPKHKKEIAVKTADLSAIKHITDDSTLTTKKKISAISEITTVFNSNTYTASIPSRKMYIAKNEPVYIKSNFVNPLMKKLKTETRDNIIQWLKNEKALVPESDHLLVTNNPLPFVNEEGEEELRTLVCVNEGGEQIRRFGMLSGLGLVATESSVVLYAPGEHFQNLAAIENFPFELKPFAGSAMIVDAIKLLKGQRPALVITSFGVKKAQLVSNLKLSTNPQKIEVCEETEQVSLNTKDFENLRELLGRKPKKEADNILNALRKLLQGHASPKDTSETLSTVSDINEIKQSLPSDPHEAIFVLRVVRESLGV